MNNKLKKKKEFLWRYQEKLETTLPHRLDLRVEICKKTLKQANSFHSQPSQASSLRYYFFSDKNISVCLTTSSLSSHANVIQKMTTSREKKKKCRQKKYCTLKIVFLNTFRSSFLYLNETSLMNVTIDGRRYFGVCLFTAFLCVPST